MPSTTTSAADGDDAPAALQPRPLNAVVGENVKRTLVMFASETSARIPVDEDR